MYLHLKFKSPAPIWVSDALIRWTIVERTGWTLEYIDSLNMADIHEFLQISDARAKARK